MTFNLIKLVGLTTVWILKSTAILDYNQHKNGVNIFDENCEESNSLRKTYCWPTVINNKLTYVTFNKTCIS